MPKNNEFSAYEGDFIRYQLLGDPEAINIFSRMFFRLQKNCGRSEQSAFKEVGLRRIKSTTKLVCLDYFHDIDSNEECRRRANYLLKLCFDQIKAQKINHPVTITMALAFSNRLAEHATTYAIRIDPQKESCETLFINPLAKEDSK